jgi:pyruvate,water dikinase
VQSLIDEEITDLAGMGKKIERHYGCPVDIEWAVEKDLTAGSSLFILQARPETVWSRKSRNVVTGRGSSAIDYIVSNMLQGKRIT